MELLLNSMREHFPRLNEQPYGLDFVRKLARKHQVKLSFAPYKPEIKGYYCIDRQSGKKHIVINSHLGPPMRDFVAIHEITHVLCGHTPPSAGEWLYCQAVTKGRVSKQDCQANNIGLVGRIPLPLFFELHQEGVMDQELMELCKRRETLWLGHSL